jgi:hypothetical protein
MIKYLLLFLLIPSVALAGTISLTVEVDGTPTANIKVYCYLYNGDIANTTAIVDNDVTDASGNVTLTTVAATTHIVKIVDPTDAKKTRYLIVTPD